MDRVALSRALFRRGEKETAKPAGTTRIYQGTATSDSDGGLLTIAIDGPAFTEDGTQSIDAVCTPAVKAGQTVQVAVIDGSPVVLGATGWGDEVDGTVQHFWHDSSGAHVSTEDGVSEGSRNSLWTSAGIFFRRQAARLLALLAGDSWTGLKVYDGLGNASANEVASFGVDTSGTDPEAEAVIGYVADRHLHVDSDSVDIMQGSTVQSSFSGSAVELGKDSISTEIKMCADTGWITASQIGPQQFLSFSALDSVSLVTRTSYPSQSLYSPTLSLAAPYVENGTVMNRSTIAENADVFNWNGIDVTRSQMSAAINGWVVSTGASGDWWWRVYRDGTFDAWCNPGSARSYNFGGTYYGWYYIEPTADGNDGPWTITGLTYSSLTYVDVTPEFSSATIASLISKNVGTNNKGFKFFLLNLEGGNKSGRVLVHARGII